MKKIINEPQGTPGWHAHRNTHFNASEAAAMEGISPYKTRTQLLREMATGDTPEIDGATQARFDNGHANEAAARPWAEEIIGAELYPVVLAEDIDGMPLSASLDGLTMMEDISWEHKSLNRALDESLSAGIIPDQYKPQMEQGLLISGAEKCLFMASSGDKDAMRWAWYESDPAVRAKLLAGWQQFKIDLANYSHVETAPEAVGRAPESLPALRIEVTGMVTASNLAEFKQTALDVFAGIKTELQTDTDFANAEKTVKWCGDVEDRLDAAKQHALSQTASIDELFRTIDEIKAEARAKRLELEKLVKSRKESIRGEILQAGQSSARAHFDALNTRIGKPYMPQIPVNFAEVMKGKKTVTSLRGAVDDELARFKISANEIADRITLNMNSLRDMAKDHAFLFSDTPTIVLKQNDDLVALIKLRIADHKAAEEKRVEAERERIRAEEAAKLKAEQDAKDREAARQKASEESRIKAEQEAEELRGKPTEATHATPKATAKPQAPAASTSPLPVLDMPKRQTRPTDAEIVEVLALHFRVHESKIVAWLLDMELETLEVVP